MHVNTIYAWCIQVSKMPMILAWIEFGGRGNVGKNCSKLNKYLPKNHETFYLIFLSVKVFILLVINKLVMEGKRKV